MWKCHKCGKAVYFAERKQSLGFDWHPECLRCQECGKRLNPGQHAEHKNKPFCHVPCYGALFGPQLFGHGTRVESHKSFGQKIHNKPPEIGGPILHLEHLEHKIKTYNDFYDCKSTEVRCREVNGRLILEGALRVYWGVHGMIHLKEDDDQRTVVTIRKRNSCKYPNIDNEQQIIDYNTTEKDNNLEVPIDLDLNKSPSVESDLSLTDTMSFEATSIAEDSTSISSMSSSKDVSPSHRALTLPSKLHVKDLDWDEIDDLLQVERKVDENDKLYQTMPSPMPSQSSLDFSDISPTESTKTSNSIESSSLTTTTTQNQPSDETTTTTTASSSTLLLTDQDYDQETLTLSHNSSSSNTLKACDFEDFKKQISEDFINGTNDMQTVNDGTLKLNQPIDPSRINDSLKLYSENIMSKSFNGETAPLMALPKDNQLGLSEQFNNMTRSYHGNENRTPIKTGKKSYHRLNTTPIVTSPINSPYRNYLLQKSESTSTQSTQSSYRNNITEDDSWIEKTINRSKSGPNCFGLNNFVENDLQNTLRPSTIRKIKPKTINIKMDCYNDNDDNVLITNDDYDEDDDEFYRNNIKNNGANFIGNHNEKEIYPDADSSSTAMDDEVVLRRPKKAGSTAIKRRSGNRRSRTKLKRRCSINGHYYNRETSFFTPPHGSQMSVWITSMVNTHEVVNLLLEKYKVDNRAENFTLFIIRDNGEQRRLREEDYPLVVRIMLGPHEDVAKLFLVDSQETPEISLEVAQFLNLSIPECRSILDKYSDEEERETAKIRDKYAEMRKRITQRMESLKVRL